MNKVITIGRELGSGGRELGRKLAAALGYEYYDKEIITEISKRTELSENYVKQVVECNPHDMFPITIGRSFTYVDAYALERKQSVFREKENVLKEMVEKSNCVIVGRCADYILKECNPYRIFVCAEMETRMERCYKRQIDEGREVLTDKKLRKKIKAVDKGRARYYEFFTGKEWGNKHNYDICINTTNVSVDDAVASLVKLIKD